MPSGYFGGPILVQETKAKLKLDCTEISKRERERRMRRRRKAGKEGGRRETDRGREGKKERRGKMERNFPDAVS